MCGANLVSAPFAGAPIEYFALRDQVVHRVCCFRNRHARIGAMAVVEIQILDLQTTESIVAGLDHVFARETGLIRLIVLPTEKNFAGNKETASTPAGVFEN